MEKFIIWVYNTAILISMYPYYFATGLALLIGGLAAVIVNERRK